MPPDINNLPENPDSNWYENRKRQRRQRRIFAYILTALKEKLDLEMFKFLTVTTSPNSKGHNNIDELRQCWKEFIRRVRRRYGVFEYLAVIERNKSRNLLHIHAIVYAPYIPQKELSEIWKQVTGAYIVFIESLFIYEHTENGARKIPIKDLKVVDYQKVLRTAAGYIAKYVGKEGVQKRLWVSRGFSVKWRENRRLRRIGFMFHKDVFDLGWRQRMREGIRDRYLSLYKWAKVVNPVYIKHPVTGKVVEITKLRVLWCESGNIRIVRYYVDERKGVVKVWYVPVYETMKEEGELGYLLEDPDFLIEMLIAFDALAHAPPDILPI